MKEAHKYIIGYFVGFGVFAVLVPLGFYGLSKLDFVFQDKGLIQSETIRFILFCIIFAFGAFFAAWSNIYLYKIGKGGPTDAFGVSISPQTKKLVTTGPYAYCRNPMVFGAFSMYLSIVVLLNSIMGIIALLLLLFLVIRFLIRSEENRLLKDFGEEYEEYRKHVPMIFPILRGTSKRK